ncbi:hypothetical protein DNTS_031626, partial [Danionella cerebrum]
VAELVLKTLALLQDLLHLAVVSTRRRGFHTNRSIGFGRVEERSWGRLARKLHSILKETGCKGLNQRNLPDSCTAPSQTERINHLGRSEQEALKLASKPASPHHFVVVGGQLKHTSEFGVHQLVLLGLLPLKHREKERRGDTAPPTAASAELQHVPHHGFCVADSGRSEDGLHHELVFALLVGVVIKRLQHHCGEKQTKRQRTSRERKRAKGKSGGRQRSSPEMVRAAPGSRMPLLGRTQYLRGAVVFTLKHTLRSEGFLSFSVAVTTSVKGPERAQAVNTSATKRQFPGDSETETAEGSQRSLSDRQHKDDSRKITIHRRLRRARFQSAGAEGTPGLFLLPSAQTLSWGHIWEEGTSGVRCSPWSPLTPIQRGSYENTLSVFSCGTQQSLFSGFRSFCSSVFTGTDALIRALRRHKIRSLTLIICFHLMRTEEARPQAVALPLEGLLSISRVQEPGHERRHSSWASPVAFYFNVQHLRSPQTTTDTKHQYNLNNDSGFELKLLQTTSEGVLGEAQAELHAPASSACAQLKHTEQTPGSLLFCIAGARRARKGVQEQPLCWSHRSPSRVSVISGGDSNMELVFDYSSYRKFPEQTLRSRSERQGCETLPAAQKHHHPRAPQNSSRCLEELSLTIIL